MNAIHPARKAAVAKALKFFSVAAWVTGIFLIILVIRMVCQYIFKLEIPAWATWVAILHGWAYVAYLGTVLNLGIKARLKPIVWLTTALAGTIPFLSFYVENKRRTEITAQYQL